MNLYAIALGMFDGVHIGHRAVLTSAISSGFKSLVVTFDSLPFKSGGILMSLKEKEETLKAFGIAEVEFLNFSEVKDLAPLEFLDKLSGKYNVGKITCGADYRFGKNAQGDTAFLRDYCSKRDIIFDEIPPVTHLDAPVSSTLIKELLGKGEVEKASQLLAVPFSFSARIEKGDQRGRTIGFPTANQVYPSEYVKLKQGVYQTIVTIEGKNFDAVTNIGVRPTYPKDFITAETHIIDFSGDLYGKEMKTQIIKYLREEEKFDSLEQLQRAIAENVFYVKQNSKLK